ncbi:MAG: VOC family protein [bacterium]
MTVLRIVANLFADEPAEAAGFYQKLFGVDVLMDMGFIVTLGSKATASAQISLAREGGSGTPVPDLSIEVDDLEGVLACAKQMNVVPIYGPVLEPWGVRRFFCHDPSGRLLNVLSHSV